MSDSARAPASGDVDSDAGGSDDCPDPPSPRVPARAREKSAWPQRRKVGSTLHVWERLETVQRMLASGMAPSTVTTTLMSEHGVDRHEAEHYQAVVRARWRANASREDGEQEFLRLKAVVLKAIEDASTRKIPVRTGTDEDTKEPIYEIVEQPDSKAVIAGAALWARMIGRLDPPQAPPALPPGEQPATEGAVTVIDRSDLNAELRARRAKPADGGKP